MNKTWIVIITIILTTVVVVCASYYYLNNKAESEKANLQRQIDELNDQISDLQSQSSTTTSDETVADDEKADWETYTNEEYGFSFQYPNDVTSNEFSDQYFSVIVNNINTIEDMPMGYDKESAIADKEALADGDVSAEFFGMAIEDSYKLLDIEDALAKEFTILSQLEVCDVQFRREAVIYKDNYQIILDLVSNEEDKIINNNAGYFKSDPTVCGTSKLWSDADGFYDKLTSGTSDSVSQKWFTNFDKIIATFEFAE